MSRLDQHAWRRIVIERILPSRLPAGQRDDIVSELASHLEETYESAQSRGMDDSEATKLALDQVKDWKALGKRIQRAKSTEELMNPITKRYLLPAMAILFPIGLVLVFLDRAAVVQRLIWIVEMALLLCAAAYEGNRLNQRTRSVWLPGFVSLTSASLFLFAEEMVMTHDSSFYFTSMSLRPDHVSSGLPFYLSWLGAQLLCGAAAAYLSRRAGGSIRARVLAAAFPAIVMFALWILVIPVSALAEHNQFLWNHPLLYLEGVFIWAVPPAIALVAGAGPFLMQPARQARVS